MAFPTYSFHFKTRCPNKLTLTVFSRYSRRKIKFNKSRPSNYYLNQLYSFKRAIGKASCVLSLTTSWLRHPFIYCHPSNISLYTYKKKELRTSQAQKPGDTGREHTANSNLLNLLTQSKPEM